MTSSPRSVDHCVLPVIDLDVARARFGALGFTVAPDAMHPFGTRNACIYLADDTYLEPLAVVDAARAREVVRRGNAFIARNLAWRFRNRGEGFSALVMKTKDASRDHRGFVEAGFSGGRMLRFSRAYLDAQGARGRLSFRLAMAADLRAPDVYFFTCERVAAPAGDRGALAVHENGALGLAGAVLTAREPDAWRELLEAVTQTPGRAGSGGEVLFRTDNAQVGVTTPAAFAERFGAEAADDPGLRLAAVRVRVADLARTEACLRAHGVDHDRRGARILVPPAPGQGVPIEFAEPT